MTSEELKRLGWKCENGWARHKDYRGGEEVYALWIDDVEALVDARLREFHSFMMSAYCLDDPESDEIASKDIEDFYASRSQEQ